MTQQLPIGVIYDHRDILNPLFRTLACRGLSYTIHNPYDLSFSPGAAPNNAILYNDFTAPPYQFKTAGSVRLTNEFIKHFENNECGRTTTIINGSRTSDLIFSKARQLSFFTSHRLRIPNTIVTTVRNIPAAAEALQFPIVIKEVANHSESLFIRIENEDELIRKFVTNFFTNDEGLPIVIQEWASLTEHKTIRVDLINGSIVHATAFRVSLHPDYNRPFLLEAREVDVPKSVSDTIRRVTLESKLELVTIEFGFDQKNHDPVFLGVHPHNLSYQATPGHETKLTELTTAYIQERLATVTQEYDCV